MANDIIDINVYETVETVDITVEPNLTTININSVTGGGAVTSVNGQTGEVVIATSDNNFTTALKNKLDSIASGAEVNVNADWNATSGDAQILNKPTIPIVTGFVPYTGANQDVNLGEFGLQTGNIEFDLTPTDAPTTVGSLVWNDLSGTLDLKLKGGAVTLQIGQETVARIVNKTATNITLLEANYQAVRVTGAQGQRPKVDLAQANNDLNSTTTLGLVTETILNNQEGFITTSGQVQQINTTGSLQGETWTDGDILYLSGTVAGRITNIKPIAPIHTVIIGFVEYAHINQGKIFVKVDNGYELDELHNVSASTPNNNEALVYDTPTLLWKPKALTTAFIADSTDKRYQTDNQKLYNDATSSIQTQLNSKKRTAVFNNRSTWSFPIVAAAPFPLIGSTNFELSTANINTGTDVATTSLALFTVLPLFYAPYNCKVTSVIIDQHSAGYSSWFSSTVRLIIGSNLIAQNGGVTPVTITNIQVCEDISFTAPAQSPNAGSLYQSIDLVGNVTIPKGHGIIPLLSNSRLLNNAISAILTIQITIEEI